MTTPDATVLVVEDEDSFVEALTVGLKREGFRVQVATDGAEALDVFDAIRPDLVLLDVMLPKISGIDVCREIRRKSSVPIIMVTAKGGEIDTVVGLEVGADDYVTKPYRLRELVARMRAVLRRRANEAGSYELSGEALEVGDVALDPERHEVIIRGRRRCRCRSRSSSSSSCCSPTPGGCCPRETLIDRVWGTDYVGDTKTLDVHVKRLRAKVEPDPSNPTRIVTIRGLGYKYDVPRSLIAAGPGPGRPARTMALDVDPRRMGAVPVTQAAGGRGCLPPVAVRPAGAHPRAGGGRRRPGRDRAGQLALLRPRPERRRAGRSSSTSRSPWRRLAVVAPFIGPALDRSVGGRRWMLDRRHGRAGRWCAS